MPIFTKYPTVCNSLINFSYRKKTIQKAISTVETKYLK